MNNAWKIDRWLRGEFPQVFQEGEGDKNSFCGGENLIGYLSYGTNWALDG